MVVSVGIFAPGKAKFLALYPEDSMGDLHPVTLAISFCMNITGVSRLFYREDYHELIFRLAIIFDELGIAENFFGDDFLFSFIHEEYSYVISIKDLENHIGLHVHDIPDAPVPFGKWIAEHDKYWSRAGTISYFINLINPGKDIIASKDMGKKEHMVSPEIINKAEITARSAIRDISGEVFDDFILSEARYLQNLKDRLDFINSPPPMQFDWDRFPYETQQIVLRTVFMNYHKEGMTLEELEKEGWRGAWDLVFLAWLFANGFVINAPMSEIDPRFDVDIRKYDGMDGEGGVNLQCIYDMFELEYVLPYLKESIDRSTE